MIKSFLFAGVAASSLFAPAFAGGLPDSYVGAGVAVGTQDGGTAGAINGRYAVPGAPVSVRPQLTIGENTGGSLAVTGDLPVAEGVNLYGGGGAGFGAGTALNTSDEVVGFAQVGVEGAVSKDVVLFADLKIGFGGETTYVPTIGVGYRF